MIRGFASEIEKFAGILKEEVKQVQSQKQYTELKDRYLSRKRGICSELNQKLREIPAKNKAEAGKLINRFKQLVSAELEVLADNLKKEKKSNIDPTLPAPEFPVGNSHLISIIKRRIEDIFVNMGYQVVDGSEIESEYHNFTALNIPEHHPARDEQDTFFIRDMHEMILRTHTSPVQIRFMQNHKPPFKIISPGKVFRKDEPDATHTPVFHQIEGLLVDRKINFSHLKGTLGIFVHTFFGEDIQIRFRPGYFPFTEPSAEIDISCFLCFGKDPNCRICKGTGWLEILGSGMVHPVVLNNCGIDPDQYSGFAFGMGVERIALLRYGIPDLRMFYENDIRFLRQFS